MSSVRAAKTSRPSKSKPLRTSFHPFTVAGIVLVSFALVILTATYWPVIVIEMGYTARMMTGNNAQPVPMTPVNTDFGVVIPKLGANAHVIADVNPYDRRVYQEALTHGVAQAAGTAKPGQAGNIFLFSHSSVNFYDATRYNSVFYLLTKLEPGDEIDLYYQGNKHTYRVTSKKTVDPTAVEYLTTDMPGRETVTLMTCWPPGTSFKRLLVIAEKY